MLPEFASVIPESIKNALTYLSSLENVKIFAGGTDLLVKMRRVNRAVISLTSQYSRFKGYL